MTTTQQAVEKTKETLEEKIELIVDSAFVQGWEAALKLSQKHSIEPQVQAILSLIDEEKEKSFDLGFQVKKPDVYTSPFTSDGNKKDDFIKYEKEIETVASAIVGAVDKYDVDVATTHLKGIAREIEHEIYAKAYEDAAHRFRMREDEIIGVVIKRIEEYITKEEMPVPKYNNNLIITEGTERSKHLIEWHNGALLKVKKFLKIL